MAVKEECTCKYKHCLHAGEPLLKSEAVKIGRSSYYHPDCYETKAKIEEIIDYFGKEINPDVIIHCAAWTARSHHK